jgi:prepilin-type processing-associated H-X9-DG protein
VFAAHLVDGAYFEPEEIKQLLLCPASHQREAQFNGRSTIRIPTVEELRSATDEERSKLLRQMLFSYAYRLGYVENEKYHCVKKRKRSCEPILADAPVFDANGLKLVNHGGLGFNVLYVDGHLEFKREFAIPGDKNVYLNLYDKPAAGFGQDDIVLAPSAISPGVNLPQATSK